MTEKKTFSFARFYNKYGVAILLLAVIIAASMLSSAFLTSENITNVLRQIAVIMILGSGCTFVIVSANINIAYDGLLICEGCTAALLMARTQNMIISFAAAVVVGIVFGYLYGVFVTKFQIPGFIVGLAFNSISAGIILLVTNGRPVQKTLLGPKFKVLGQGYIGPIPICLIATAIVLIVSAVILNRTCFGMKVRAIGGNKDAAVASGINVNREIRKIFVFDGITCAIGSVVFMSRINSGDPTAGAGLCFDAITAVCVGGVSIQGGAGSVLGTMVGAAIVGVLNNMLNLMNVNSNWQDVVSGVVILGAIAVDTFVKNSLAKNVKRSIA